MQGRSAKRSFVWSAVTRGIYLTAVAVTLVACGGGHSSSSSSYTVGGTISGLNAGSVDLINGTTTVTVSAGATTWVFPSAFPAGSTYSVAVLVQPVGELCEVISNSSAASLTGNVNDVAVACNDYGQWIWQGGLDTVDANGAYGTQNAASANNLPGARYSASSWTDPSGNFWLFGGAGYDANGVAGSLNDLWQYSPSSGQWTWISGGSAANADGVYGTQGTASAGNAPGARYSASSWIDASGDLWLFGGYGYDSNGVVGKLNDLWRYNPSTGLWAWISGGSSANANGVYGTQGSASASNVPGARYSASSWIDASGNLWLFGGYGYDSNGVVGKLDDLWRYSPSTGLWTWVSGANAADASGTYGTQGTASVADLPGARQAANSWIDSSGNLWLFGGYGYDSSGDQGYLNDLWQFSPSTGLWTWISGGNGHNATGIYGVEGTASSSNVPGGRQAANSWIDSSGNLWLFGGAGYDTNGAIGDLNDLWRFSPSDGLWNWVAGGNTGNSTGGYGTQGAASGGSSPGGRQAASSWIGPAGHLWLFGGVGYGSTGNGYLNDLWQFVPP